MKTKDITLTSVLLSMLIICSQIAIPFGPVPITLQTFVIVLIGMIVKPKIAFLTTVLYLAIGLVGLPVFAGGLGGFQSLLSPSFGFIISFIPAATVQSYYLTLQKYHSTKNYIIASIINYVINYSIGLSYMAFILNVYVGNALNFSQILGAGLVLFIPGDLIKNSTAIILAKKLRPKLSLSFR